MGNFIFFAVLVCAIFLWILFVKLGYKSSYKRYLIKCYKLHIRPFNIFQYYYHKFKGDM